MPFWSSQTLESRLNQLVATTTPDAIKQGSIELRLGPQVILSGEQGPTVVNLELGKEISIPEGQLALLLTEEEVNLPPNALAFISLKTGVKSKGLVNVSGFHVDPGYSGRLKFWVYNVGNQEIILRRGDHTFLIWFGSFDMAVRDPYGNRDPAGQRVVTSENLNNMRGRLCSPAVLQGDIKKLQDQYHWLVRLNWTVLAALLAAIIGIILLVVPRMMEEPRPTEIRLNVVDQRPHPTSSEESQSIRLSLPTLTPPSPSDTSNQP